MGICDISLKTDLKNKSYTTDKACKQGDTLQLHFNLYDNSVIADLTGYTCILKANKANGMGYDIINDVVITIGNGTAMVSCSSSLTQFAGLLKLELTFIDSIKNLQKTTFDIDIQVDRSVLATAEGGVPVCIITALEKLDKNLADISDKVTEANSAKNSLINATTNANNANTILTKNTTNANSVNDAVSNNIISAKLTVEELKRANNEYTNHINNSDIHVTKEQKDKWNAYETRINELTNIIDSLYSQAFVIDDDENNVTDDDENKVIV